MEQNGLYPPTLRGSTIEEANITNENQQPDSSLHYDDQTTAPPSLLESIAKTMLCLSGTEDGVDLRTSLQRVLFLLISNLYTCC